MLLALTIYLKYLKVLFMRQVYTLIFLVIVIPILALQIIPYLENVQGEKIKIGEIINITVESINEVFPEGESNNITLMIRETNPNSSQGKYIVLFYKEDFPGKYYEEYYIFSFDKVSGSLISSGYGRSPSSVKTGEEIKIINKEMKLGVPKDIRNNLTGIINKGRERIKGNNKLVNPKFVAMWETNPGSAFGKYIILYKDEGDKGGCPDSALVKVSKFTGSFLSESYTRDETPKIPSRGKKIKQNLPIWDCS